MSEQKARYSKDCRICRAEQEAEIQTLQNEIERLKVLYGLEVEETERQKLINRTTQKQIEAAKTTLKSNRLCHHCWARNEVLEVFGEQPK